MIIIMMTVKIYITCYKTHSITFYTFQIINSILEMKQNSLVLILCNPKGSHIADAFFESEFVGEKSKEKFIKVLEVSEISEGIADRSPNLIFVVFRVVTLR